MVHLDANVLVAIASHEAAAEALDAVLDRTGDTGLACSSTAWFDFAVGPVDDRHGRLGRQILRGS